MRRQNPFFTPVGLLLAFLFTGGLVLVTWLKGGMAFNPGPLSAKSYPEVLYRGYRSHADFEGRCELCHQPLRTIQAELCQDCHTNVAEQARSQSGVHGRIENLDQCRACHPDHRGRDFDPIRTALAAFDHSSASFSLAKHLNDYDQNPIPCGTCHDRTQPGFQVQPAACRECHRRHEAAFVDQHTQDFGPACLDCHDGVDRMVDFDHASTGFSLEGQHAEQACTACHVGGQFAGIASDCASCHAEPPLHAGLFGLDCAACHKPSGWVPAVLDNVPFDHAADTAFSLVRHEADYQGQVITCLGCHTPDGPGRLALAFDAQSCLGCHRAEDASFMTRHTELFGAGCTTCHDGVDRLTNFDHSQVFVLDGRHAEIECQACHAGQVFRGTPNLCVNCHAEPEIHAGFFGLECQNCHTTQAWAPAFLRDHTFPLDHGEQGEVACQVCHPNNYIEYTCYGCHEHQESEIVAEHQEEGIGRTELVECARCHPTGLEDEGD